MDIARLRQGIPAPGTREPWPPCHALPPDQWCDRDGPGGFMGHTCVPVRTDDGDLRMLGARDGLVTGLLLVRRHIAVINNHRIPKHHTRRLAEREAVLRPLREIEVDLARRCSDTQTAYETTRKPKVVAK